MGNRRDRSKRRGDDPGASIRALRLELLFREELNSILEGELGDRRLQGVRCTFVELSRDGSRARVWYALSRSPDPSSADETKRRDEAAAALERATAYLRTRLCDALPLKRSPELCFRFDPAAHAELSAEMSH
jgi:ribosome-binding factor A